MLHAIKEDGHAEEVYCSLDSTRTSSLAGRGPQAQGIVHEGTSGANPFESRRRWPEVDRPTNRRSLQLPDQDRREYPATAGDPRLRRDTRQEATRNAATGQALGRRTGGEDHCPAIGKT